MKFIKLIEINSFDINLSLITNNHDIRTLLPQQKYFFAYLGILNILGAMIANGHNISIGFSTIRYESLFASEV